jgi:hypothetical protein
MPWVDSNFLDNIFTEFLAELRQFINRQLAEILWVLYLIE